MRESSSSGRLPTSVGRGIADWFSPTPRMRAGQPAAGSEKNYVSVGRINLHSPSTKGNCRFGRSKREENIFAHLFSGRAFKLSKADECVNQSMRAHACVVSSTSGWGLICAGWLAPRVTAAAAEKRLMPSSKQSARVARGKEEEEEAFTAAARQLTSSTSSARKLRCVGRSVLRSLSRSVRRSSVRSKSNHRNAEDDNFDGDKSGSLGERETPPTKLPERKARNKPTAIVDRPTDRLSRSCRRHQCPSSLRSTERLYVGRFPGNAAIPRACSVISVAHHLLAGRNIHRWPAEQVSSF